MSRKLLSLFVTASLLFVPSISFATDVMTRCYSKTISALDSYTKLLIHGDSIGDSTGKTVTANGNAAVTTTQYKFAEVGRSIVFDGTGDYLSLADSDDWDFGSGDYTIDFWVRFNTLPSAGNQVVFYSHKYTPTNRAVQFRMYNNSGAYQLGYYVQDLNSSNPDLIAIDVAVSITTGTWYHIAAVRNGTNTRVYLNGSSVGYNTQSYTYPNFDSNLWIGCEYGTIKYLDGWMDEIRVSKDVARWTSNFTPPTAPYDGARTVINITGLDGNTDEEYELMVRRIEGESSESNMYVRPNNDSGNNYGDQQMYGANTSTGAARNAVYSGFLMCQGIALNNISFAKLLLYAKSGYVRTALHTNAIGISGTSINQIKSRGSSWNNTSDNITSLAISTDVSNGLGIGTNIELYKKSAKQ